MADLVEIAFPVPRKRWNERWTKTQDQRSASVRRPLLFFVTFVSRFAVVGTWSLWATLQRRPSAAANPQGSLWHPTSPPEFVTQGLVRLAIVVEVYHATFLNRK